MRTRSGTTSVAASRIVRPSTRTRPARIAAVACVRERIPSLERARFNGTRAARLLDGIEPGDLAGRRKIDFAGRADRHGTNRTDLILQQALDPGHARRIAGIEPDAQKVLLIRRRDEERVSEARDQPAAIERDAGRDRE